MEGHILIDIFIFQKCSERCIWKLILLLQISLLQKHDFSEETLDLVTEISLNLLDSQSTGKGLRKDQSLSFQLELFHYSWMWHNYEDVGCGISSGLSDTHLCWKSLPSCCSDSTNVTGVQNTKVVASDCCVGVGLGSMQHAVTFQPLKYWGCLELPRRWEGISSMLLNF